MFRGFGGGYGNPKETTASSEERLVTFCQYKKACEGKRAVSCRKTASGKWMCDKCWALGGV